MLLVTAEMPPGESGPSGLTRGGAKGCLRIATALLDAPAQAPGLKGPFPNSSRGMVSRVFDWARWGSSAITLGCTLLVRLPPVASLHFLSEVSQSLAPVPYPFQPTLFLLGVFKTCCSQIAHLPVADAPASRVAIPAAGLPDVPTRLWPRMRGLAPASRCPDPVSKADRLCPHL